MRLLLLCSGTMGCQTTLEALEFLEDSGLAVDEVHLVTSAQGWQRLEPELSVLGDGVAASTVVHVPGCGPDGAPRDANLRAMNDVAFGCVSEAVARSARVVVALPRGRKDVVGLMLMAELQTVGRVGDRVIVTPDGAELPLLFLATPFGPAPVAEATSPTSGVEAHTGRAPTLWLDDHSRTMEVGGIRVPLRPAQYFWYSALATYPGPAPTLNDLRAAGCAGASEDMACPARRLRAYLAARYECLFPEADHDVTAFILQAVGDPANLLPVVSHLNGRIRRALGPAAERYLLRSPRSAPGYRIDVGRTSIRTIQARPRKRQGRLPSS